MPSPQHSPPGTARSTPRGYGNEASVGRAIRDSGLARSDVFVTTKLPGLCKTYVGAQDLFATSLASLDMDYVDLYLIHAPWPWDAIGGDFRDGNAAVCRAMEEFYSAGAARAISVSNFSVDDIDALVSRADIVPMVHQYRYFIGHTKPEIGAHSRSLGMLTQGYSPFATGALLSNPDVVAMAASYDRSVAQLSIRYALQNGVSPLPKTTDPKRMAESAQVDFDIADRDMAALDALVDTIDDAELWL